MPPVRHPFPLRWNDNDQYGHVNNTVFYEAMDTAVNAWMIREGVLDPRGHTIGVCVASSCEFGASASFPEDLEVAIRVEHVGTTSVTWDLAILRSGQDDAIAHGKFTHVFVDAESRRPVPIPDALRTAMTARFSGA